MTPPERRPGAGIQYSEVAVTQLDNLQKNRPDLYEDVLTSCALIFSNPSRAQSTSSAIRTENGIVMRMPVPARHPYKIFWTTGTPRIEAVFPYDS